MLDVVVAFKREALGMKVGFSQPKVRLNRLVRCIVLM